MPSAQSALTLRSFSCRVAVLALKTILVLSAPPPAETYNICTCQCCYSGICIDRPNSEEWNGTFQVAPGRGNKLVLL